MTNDISLLRKMQLTQDSGIKFRSVSVALPIIVICIGFIVILGWYLDLPILKSLLPGRVTMKVSTALSFIISASSLLVWHQQQANQSNQTKSITEKLILSYLYLAPTLLILFTVLTFIEYGFRLDLGTSWFSLPDSIDAVDAAVAGRMSPNTALSFFWFNGGILLLTQNYFFAVQLVAVTIMAIAFISLTGHIYDLAAFYGMNSGTGMAVHTALCFMFLAFALLGTRADKGFMKVITIDEAGGTMARWLLPLVTIIPPFIGWFFWWNFSNLDVALETRIALRTLVEITILDLVVLWAAKQLNEVDRQRQNLFRDLKESEQQLRLAFDRAVIGKALLSIEGKFLKVNPALCELVGYREANLLQFSYRDITHSEDLGIESDYRQQLLADKIGFYQVEKRYTHRTGRLIWVLLGVSLAKDNLGRPKYFVAQIQDITSRKQAEEAIYRLNNELEARVQQRTSELETSNRSLKAEIIERQKIETALLSSTATNRALLDAIPDWMFRLSNDGTLISFKAPRNTHLASLFNKFIGKRVDEVLPLQVAEVVMAEISEALTTQKVRVCEHQLNRRTISKVYEARIAVSSSNEVVAIVRDITKRKRVEQNICNALEQERKLNELKTRFVTTTSHEFRTPLASILSSAELLEHYSYKWSDEKKLSHLYRIQASVKHMTGLLNDVLLLGKADAGKLELSPTVFDLSEFCQELVEEMNLISETHQIELFLDNDSSDRDFTVCLDDKLLRHILQNLFSNAIKYSPRSDKVHFVVSCELQQAVFRVRDFGIGIPDEEQDRLFDSFHRFSNADSIPGTGLGLAIVKRAIDLHEGAIAMESELGTGTTFTITLPYLEKA